MSFNNHDKDDPNGRKYGKSTDIQRKNIAELLDIPDTEDDFNAMQIYLMAKSSLNYAKWKEWFDQSGYSISPSG